MKNRTSITTFITILSAIGSFALLPEVKTAPEVTPPPDGCYPGFTTAEGCNALQNLTTGEGNTGVGWRSLFLVGDGSFNTGVGVGALLLNNADNNTAVGAAALLLNTTGTENTAIGDVALATNDSDGSGLANNNTAVGAAALQNNVDGSENTVVGTGSGQNIIAGFNNTYVGNFEGSDGAVDESSTIRIGDITENGFGSAECFIGGIFNNFQPRSATVVVVTLDLTNDHLGWDVVVSPDQPGSAPSVPSRNAPSSLRRSVSSAPIQRPMPNGKKVGKVEMLEATVAQQQRQIEGLAAQLKEQAAQIQKVSAQFEVSKPAPQVVVNKP